ncbi:MAG: CdaR family protein [Vicinamibacterales bacterium]
MAYHPFRHLGLKTLAIALATLLWLTVAGEHVVERSMRVPLEFRNIPAQLEITGEPPPTVEVRLRGSSAVLGRLDPGEVVAVLDLTTGRPGSRLFHLRNDEVRAPFGVQVSQVLPSTVSLELEHSASRMLPVKPVILGDPAAGFVVGRQTAEPAMVKVIGPESRVWQLTDATTEPVSIAGSRDRVRDVVTVGVANAAVRLETPTRATVIVEILPAPVERELSGVPVRWRNLGAGMRAQVAPSVATISMRGRTDALDQLRADGIDAFVDLAGLGTGRYNLRVQVDPVEHIGLDTITPSVVQVTIR